jgi:hypothetical protein
MRKILALTVVFLSACTAMKPIDGTARKFLTQAGATIAFDKPMTDILAAVQVYMTDRGYQEFKRSDVSENNHVIFFKGERQSRRGNNGSSFVSDGIGSWFAVRFVTEGNKTTLSFYGKPTIDGKEACGDGDKDLKDTGYACTPYEQRADWPGHQLVEGREETQVISTVIARLGERWPVN